jgi:FdhD protein
LIELGNVIETEEIIKINDENQKITNDELAVEFPFTIFLNDVEIVTLLVTPFKLKFLTVGFLFDEGFLRHKDDIKSITIDEEKGVANVKTNQDINFIKEMLNKRLITSGCGRSSTFYNVKDSFFVINKRSFELNLQDIFNLNTVFQKKSELFKRTGCVHSSAICNINKILVFADDIGRHNSVDKVIGECILNDIDLFDKILLTTGRVSSDIVLKAGKVGLPVIVSHSAVTSLAIKFSKRLNIALLGFTRFKRVNVYNKGNICLKMKN